VACFLWVNGYILVNCFWFTGVVLSFATGYLTPREAGIWELRRGKLNQSEIGRRLSTSRQAAHQALVVIDAKMEQAFSEAAKINGLDLSRVNLVEGIAVAHSTVHDMDVILSYSVKNGLRIWYMHEGECSRCAKAKECRDYLVVEAAERGIELDDRKLPTKMAFDLFSRFIEGVS